MAMQYIVPRIAIDESNVGPRPTPGISVGVIGVVGTFTKGPINQPKIIGGMDRLISTFGPLRTDLTGPLTMTGALNQGATDYVVCRIAGSDAKTASLVLKDTADKDSIKITAQSPGIWANGATSDIGIKVAITAGTTNGTFRMVVVVGRKSRTYDNLTLDTLAEVNDVDVIVEKVEGATSIPAPIPATPLEGGADGKATDADYIGEIKSDGSRTGLKALEPQYCNIVVAAQQTSPAIRAALLTHAANAGLEDGLRLAVLNAKRSETVEQAIKETENLDSMRAFYGYPYVEPMEVPGQYVAPDGYIAGRLATLEAHYSPSNQLIEGILSTERQLTMAELMALTQARVMPITPEKGRGFRIRNGVTLSSDPAWNQIAIRRTFDKIEMMVYNATQWAKSQPHVPRLWQNIATQIDMMLEIMKTKGEIFDYKPTVCDESNNPPEMVQARILNTRIRVRPIYAADFIDHYVERLLGNE